MYLGLIAWGQHVRVRIGGEEGGPAEELEGGHSLRARDRAHELKGGSKRGRRRSLAWQDEQVA